MRSDRTRTICFVLSLVVLGMNAWCPRVAAGPGTYDPATRTFNLTYTYAVVPSPGMMGAQLEQLGQVQPVTPDQDAKIRAFFAAVSDKLWDATNQRGKIGTFNCVDNVKQADVIVSPTGKIGRGGYATPGGFEDRQGHLVISYEDLTVSGKDIDAQLTIFHELCHYLFALPDEYRDGENVGLCPIQNGSGPGCLMDNYWFDGPRHGWYGRFCNGDHNAQAPLPQTIIAGQTAQQTCAQLIDLFFQSHLKGAAAANPPAGGGAAAGGGADAGAAAAGGAGAGPGTGSQPTPNSPFSGIFASLVDATGSFLRDFLQDSSDAGKTTPSAGGLLSLAEKFLRTQVAFGKQTSNMTTPTPDQVKLGVKMAVKTAQTSRQAAPPRFGGTVVSQLIQKAKELAAKELGKPGNASLTTSPLTSSAATRTKANTTLARRIETELLSFAKGALGLTDSNLPSDQKAFSPQEKAYIKQVSADAATGATDDDTSPLGTYLAAAKIHIKISQIIARSALDTRDELGLPGTEIFRSLLSDAEKDLVKLALPGNPFQGFGLRRTVIFAPLPLKPEDDHIALQGSPSFTYSIIRKLAVNKISSLITREKIVVLPEDKSPPVFDLPAPQDSAARLGEVLKQLTVLTDQVRRNRFDNIIVIVPPGGLPENLGDQLESLRKRMALNPDVRLDIVQIDTGNVPERLRDLCARSRGSELLAFDIDSFGAIGQRLRGEGLSGSWVIIPEQGHLELTPTSQKAGDAATSAAPDPSREPRAQPIAILRDRLVLLNNLPGVGGRDATRVERVLADPSQLAADNDDKRIAEAFADYRDAVAAHEPVEKKAAVALASLFNPNFFTVRKDTQEEKPAPSKEQVSAAIVEAINAGLKDENVTVVDKLPSLAGMQEDLGKWGANLSNALAQTDFTNTILPAITQLKAFRADLDSLDDALKNINVKDPKNLKKALDLTIKARRDMADLPRSLADPSRDGSAGYLSSEDSLYRSHAMRLAIERAILVRLGRFTDSQNTYHDLANKAAQDQSQLDKLASAEQKYQAYVELSQIFSQLFQNLHKYDAMQATDNAKKDDIFAKLAGKLASAQTDNQKQLVEPAGAAAKDATKKDDTAKDAAKKDDTAKDATKKDDTAKVATKMDAAKKDDTSKDANKKDDTKNDAAAITPAPSPQYLQLLAEIYLDLYDLQNELSRGTLVTSTFARLPRKTVPPIVQLPQQAGGQGGAGGKPLAEQLLAETPLLAQVTPFDLKPFTAEEKASFDLIVGFTRDLKALQDPDDPPVVRLFDKAGADANEKGAPFLQLDGPASTNSMLVFRLPYPDRDAGRIPSGSYYPKLYLKSKHLPDRGGQVDYTFSVASANPKVLLTATLRQIAIRSGDGDEENDDEVAERGIIPRSKSVAIVETLVTAGSPVQNVDVTGFYQKIEVNGGPVSSLALSFLDDGVWPDTTNGDGVYTTKITLDPQEKRKQADYRVMIEARSNDKTSYVPTESFKKPDAPAVTGTTSKTTKAKAPAPPVDEKKPPAVPKFQRATSVNFLVEGMP